MCNGCFREKNGDIIAAIQWALDCDFRTAMGNLAEHLGLGNGHAGNGKAKRLDPLQLVARQKCVEAADLQAFGGRVDVCNRCGHPTASVSLRS